MTGFLNLLTRRLLRQVLGNRRGGVVAVAAVVILAIWSALSGEYEATSRAPDGGAAAGVYALTGKVVHIADGDTFTLLAGRRRQRIRLASIDAPETAKGQARPGQSAARAAARALADLVAGKTLTLRCFELDHYGRHVCDVPLDGGSTANERLVAAGLAWANMQGHGKYMRDPAMPALQARARRAGKGIWREAAPVPPWVWRRRCWGQGHC